MTQREVKIKDFIGIYDNYIPEAECDKAINYFKQQEEFRKSFSRMQSENAGRLFKEDTQVFLTEDHIVWWKELKPLMFNFDMALKHYEQATGVKEAYGVSEFNYTALKIQKTLPTQGYHAWHLEHNPGFENAKRALVFTIYLNDVEEGGETEFLHQSIRAKPVKGRCVIWPAAFPYVHRGNPPLQGEKYLITSWLILPN